MCDILNDLFFCFSASSFAWHIIDTLIMIYAAEDCKYSIHTSTNTQLLDPVKQQKKNAENW